MFSLYACGSASRDPISPGTGSASGQTGAKNDAALVGVWTASPPAGFRLASIRVTFSFGPDGSLGGNWSGQRANCSGVCTDSGQVIRASQRDSVVSFQISAINSTYSVIYDGTSSAGVIHGSGKVFEITAGSSTAFDFKRQ